MTDIGFGAAGTYFVVICQVYVEHQLFCHWPEGGGFAETLAIPRIRCVDGTYLETRRIEAKNVLPEAARREFGQGRDHEDAYRSPVP